MPFCQDRRGPAKRRRLVASGVVIRAVRQKATTCGPRWHLRYANHAAARHTALAEGQVDDHSKLRSEACRTWRTLSREDQEAPVQPHLQRHHGATQL